MIPVLFRVSLERRDKRPFRLWLPLFLAWLVIIPLVSVLGPFVLVAAWATAAARTADREKAYGRLLVRFYPLLFSALWSLWGFSVEIEGVKRKLLVQLN